MPNNLPTLEQLWKVAEFEPNEAQEQAIRHVDGPLYLTAGPGSGKTRVLLWRTLNLIVYYEVKPEEIFLSTFTEKAALQLREGLRSLLGHVTNCTGQYYDLSKMYVGTVHSLCQRLITDRRFSPGRVRPHAPVLMDELDQYLHLYRQGQWRALTAAAGLETDANRTINGLFGYPSVSRHQAVSNCISFFNRLSEECIEPDEARSKIRDRDLRKLVDLYEAYKTSLDSSDGRPPQTDFALSQQKALEVLRGFKDSGQVFRHVIIDEYQDTNTIQEQLFFALAEGHKNICVVGDDDQALYRFRGATVENFVEFPQRCKRCLGDTPEHIALATNYRSRANIVEFYKSFITQCDWRKESQRAKFYRVVKDLHAHNSDQGPSVIASTLNKSEDVCAEIAGLVREIVDAGKVQDPNQIAFLFPSLKSVHVGRMKDALEKVSLQVYAPRAGRFLEVDESVAVFGLYVRVFGKPERSEGFGRDYDEFHEWVDDAHKKAGKLLESDARLARFIQQRRDEIDALVHDYELLMDVLDQHGWEASDPYNPPMMKAVLVGADGISRRAVKSLRSNYFERVLVSGPQGRPRSFPLSYVINRATSLDWSVLDLFYRLCGFKHLKAMFDQAEGAKKDEGPVCNLSLISQYLGRFMDEYASILTAEFLSNDQFLRVFFSSYLYALFRRGESEYEDAQDPFPRGRIPFLTIHQAKGLEFPIVVLGNPGKQNRGPQKVEQMVHPLLDREGEPLDRMAEFDIMRMFYVALSRAKNLLVIAHYRGAGVSINQPFKVLLEDGGIPRIPDFIQRLHIDPVTLPKAELKDDELPKTYSYTGDYLLCKRCPRQYMVFRKYDFVPARSQTMFFGSLVHQTIEDLHQHLIAERAEQHGE
jgi:DNA helicase-2/ATP-dependent DNA helicase PcrA